jgi:deoxyribodipyrimidine photo-lyase
MPKYQRGLFLFHRDLRIVDNVGLSDAAKKCDTIFTAFVFTPEQVSDSNHYRSTNAIQFMLESLEELRDDIESAGGKLLTLYGKTATILAKLTKTLQIECVFFNRDYTPYARERDEMLIQSLQKIGVHCETSSDYYLQEPGTVLVESSGKMYHKFTPFYEVMLKQSVAKPAGRTTLRLGAIRKEINLPFVTLDHIRSRIKTNPYLVVKGGRRQGLARLRIALRDQADFDKTRDDMSMETSRLSAHLKFGTVSVREIYWSFVQKYGARHSLIREVIWRDFFAHLLYVYPETLAHSYYRQFDHIHWRKNMRLLELWKTGQTGFPLVDASMRELNHTGYMHNRGRMVVASFLVKTLLLPWREGERYFAQHLTDYDVASNVGNWQSIVGGGAYAMPYFRVMNPWIQSAKFDRDAVYIKRWVPELADVPARDIHRWYMVQDKYKTLAYVKPVVDYSEQKEVFLKMVADART